MVNLKEAIHQESFLHNIGIQLRPLHKSVKILSFWFSEYCQLFKILLS